MKTFETLTFTITNDGKEKKITAKPHPSPLQNNFPQSFEIAIDNLPKGKISNSGSRWESAEIEDHDLVKSIGVYIDSNREKITKGG